MGRANRVSLARAPRQPYLGIAVRDAGTEAVGRLFLRFESAALAVCRMLAVLTGPFIVLIFFSSYSFFFFVSAFDWSSSSALQVLPRDSL